MCGNIHERSNHLTSHILFERTTSVNMQLLAITSQNISIKTSTTSVNISNKQPLTAKIQLTKQTFFKTRIRRVHVLVCKCLNNFIFIYQLHQMQANISDCLFDQWLKIFSISLHREVVSVRAHTTFMEQSIHFTSLLEKSSNTKKTSFRLVTNGGT